METIYWIQRLGILNNVAIAVFLISCAVMLVTFYFVIESYCEDYDDGGLKKIVKVAGWVAGISLLAIIFVPSEKDLYVIYGVGGTIDYIKSNDTAKQLPDKVINALDAWISKQTENEK